VNVKVLSRFISSGHIILRLCFGVNYYQGRTFLEGRTLPKVRKCNYETKNYWLFIDEQLLLNTADELFCPINPASSFYPE
jgi:hypothetical protein